MRFDPIIKNEIIMQSMLLNPIYENRFLKYEERNQVINCLKESILCSVGNEDNNHNNYQSKYDDKGIKLFIIFKL